MPRVARKWCNSPILHVMTHGINQEYIFSNDIYKRKYIYALNKYVQKYNVNLICYCIMDNHSHLLIKSKNIYKISEYMRSVNTTFALFYNTCTLLSADKPHNQASGSDRCSVRER